MKYRLTRSAERLKGQPMFSVLDKVKEMERAGRNIIHFEIGDPDFCTPPNIINAACLSLKSGETHYTSSSGLYDFKKVIQETTLKNRGFLPSMEQILVVPGANISIYYAIQCLVEPGDEVIVPDPGFPTYYSVVEFCGAVPVRVPLREKNCFRMSPKDVREKITAKTRLIIINSPHNPTGSVMLPEEIREFAKIAKEHDIFLYSDEVYARMVFGENKFISPSEMDFCKERTIIANGFSKSFAMTGWRLGSVIGPEDVVAKMNLLLQTTSSCVSPFIQRAGIEAITGDQQHVKKMIKEYEVRRELLVAGLNSISGISCLKPGGAFYVFPNIKRTGMSDNEFVEFALKKANVAILPGSSFGVCGKDYVRFCYAISQDRIIEGVRRIKNALEII